MGLPFFILAKRNSSLSQIKKINTFCVDLLNSKYFFSGKRGIRTPGTPKGTTDFESAPIDHSGSFPFFDGANIKIL